MPTQVTPSPLRPNLMRPECGVVVVSEWSVGSPERQAAAIGAFAEAWSAGPSPTGLLTCNLLKNNDGRGIVAYGQWIAEQHYFDAIESHIRPRLDLVDLAVPGILRNPPVFYHLQRSRIRDTAAYPGCVVLVTFEFENPDQERQKQFVRTVFQTVDAMSEHPAGALGGHFHVSTDGLRVLNYAEWASAEDHRQAIEGTGPGKIGSGPGWQAVRAFPGLKTSSFQRYSLGLNLAAGRG
ncbi:antibiotic biosynthesis monooxygenase family protein [Paludibaculum fermentans]|uniref:antibiotic biosynthesis monooxygenase family protein n=1 Tax=Paludibaculum fermentans TaxID=1473598 RepID=UPI003EB8099E